MVKSLDRRAVMVLVGGNERSFNCFSRRMVC